MKILFICKAATEIGLGHLIRSRTLAEVASKEHEVSFIVIGSDIVRKLLAGLSSPKKIIPTEDELINNINEKYDIVILDMMCIEEKLVLYIKNKTHLCVSISPIFNQMDRMDIMFSRTKYSHNAYNLTNVKQYLGLEYAIIQKDCVRIKANPFNYALSQQKMPVAVSMGGGDAANKTRMFLQSLKKCKVPATFWVLVGEGYNHSYDSLINVIERDKSHEIILAKTNMSMWHILRNCVLAVLPGGVTTYEAAYAGLPTINMFESEDHFFLIRELEEAGVCINAGLINEDNLIKLNLMIEKYYNSREELLKMHDKSQLLIDGKGCERIIKTVEKQL